MCQDGPHDITCCNTSGSLKRPDQYGHIEGSKGGKLPGIDGGPINAAQGEFAVPIADRSRTHGRTTTYQLVETTGGGAQCKGTGPTSSTFRSAVTAPFSAHLPCDLPYNACRSPPATLRSNQLLSLRPFCLSMFTHHACSRPQH